MAELPPVGDDGPDVPAVTTPDLGQRAALEVAGLEKSGLVPYILKTIVSCLGEILKATVTIIASVFDEFLSLIVPLVTAGQGIGTGGFYDLVAAILSDLLGVEVSSESLQEAHGQRGTIGAMQAAGAGFFNVLANELLGKSQSAEPGEGIGGLPGAPGTPLTPEQGVKAAQAFLGFVLSFSVRQGNVAVLTDALSVHLLGQIREYGEMMASNLGLSRLSRQAMRPFMQTLVAGPLQEGLNRQYRPHTMDARQLASAYIRGEIDRSDYVDRLKGLGYKDGDIDLLISDTYARLPFKDVFTLHENGILTDSDLQGRVSALGFNTSDIPLMLQARQFESVAGIQREYIKGAISDLQHGVISQSTFEADVDNTNLSHEEKRWYKILGANRTSNKHKQLSLGFLKRAYLDASITLDEYIEHALALGYSQADVDLLEVELLFEQKDHAARAAAKAQAAARKAAGKTPTTPPTNP